MKMRLLFDITDLKTSLKSLGKHPWQRSCSTYIARFGHFQASSFTELLPGNASASVIFPWSNAEPRWSSAVITKWLWTFCGKRDLYSIKMKVLKFWMFLYRLNNLQYENTQTGILLLSTWGSGEQLRRSAKVLNFRCYPFLNAIFWNFNTSALFLTCSSKT